MANVRFTDPEQLSKKIRHIDQSNLDGHLFLEVLFAGLGMRNAAELAKTLPVAAAVLSRVRAGRAVSDEMLLRLNVVFGLSISGLKDLLCACTRSAEPITMQRVDALAARSVFTQREPTDT